MQDSRQARIGRCRPAGPKVVFVSDGEHAACTQQEDGAEHREEGDDKGRAVFGREGSQEVVPEEADCEEEEDPEGGEAVEDEEGELAVEGLGHGDAVKWFGGDWCCRCGGL